MFASNITINDNAAVARVFKQISLDNTGSVRLDDSTTLTSPRKMVLRHSQSTPKGSLVVVDRHLLQFTSIKLDSLGNPYTLVTNVTHSVPRSTVFAVADTDHHFAFVKNWLGVGANVTSFNLGEY